MKTIVLSLAALMTYSGVLLQAQDLTGTWQGTVKNPDARVDLRTVLKIASSEGNPIKGNFWSIDQTYLVFPATLTIQGGTIKMNIPGIAATWTGKVSADGTTMTGTLKGFSVPITWTMKRVGKDQEWTIPQPPTPAKPLDSADPSFEVATIKLSNPDPKGPGFALNRLQGGNLTMTNITLMNLMTFVYEVHPHQVIGAPAWATTEKFDITAKAEGSGQPTQDQLRVMLRKLLADRFQLALHKEQKELPVYTLTLAKGGIRISKDDPKAETTGIIFRGPGSVLLNNSSMDDLTRMLQNNAVDRPVINQTGVAGKYDFSLVWTPEQALTDANTNALAADGANTLPGVFEAIQQQLGLKLDATKLVIDVQVIDKVEKPSAN